ncbi:MAG: PDZ domain-containing protein [Bacteroidales bacterium]|nr:PDZ domain-containing protein [Bacteroidales bacterium]
MKKILLPILGIFLSIYAFSIDETRLLRFPTVANDTIIFCYSGDLYLVAATGGVATRITSHEGYEMFPHFSPDGQTIAYTAQYDGNTEVYTIPLSGGNPTRITYTATLSRDDISDRMGPNNIVMGWTPDGKHVIYRSRGKSFNDFKGRLYLAPLDGGMSKQIPLATGSWCSYSPNNKQLAYNKVFREFRTWKYYKGGMADDIWVFDFNNHTSINITNNPAQDIFPMWAGDKIYFLSDRDRVMNLFVYDTKTKETNKLTSFSRYDIKFPSLGDNKIIFENGGYIYYYDIDKSKITKLNIKIREDFAASRTVMKDISSNATNLELAPDASRIVLSARGDIFSTPVHKGITKNITNSSNAHDRNPVWSPNGKYIAYISDKSGEYNIYMHEYDNPATETQLTNFETGYIYKLKWSPDSKNLLWNNKKLSLNSINIETKKITNIHKSIIREIHDYNWSPDSKWIAFTDQDSARVSQIYLYNIEQDKKHVVTTAWYDSFSPVFSHDGKYLFFVSNRDFNPIYSNTEWNIAYKDMSRVYLLTLREDVPSPFELQNDKVFSEETPSIRDTSYRINIENIENRIEVLPMEAGSYRQLNYIDDKLYFIESHHNQKSKLKFYNFKNKKTVDLGEFYTYKISSNNKKMLLSKSNKYYVINIPESEIKLSDAVDLKNLKKSVNLKQEWEQIFNEAWRQMRDYFYDPLMHRVEWKKQRDKYAELLPYVNDRNDLNYIIGEMIGELNVGHAYVNGGDKKSFNSIKMGLLGAELEKDTKTGYFRITKIYTGENWNKNRKSPLLGIGLNINEGDYIISINSKDLSKVPNIYSLLIDKAGKIIEIEINDKPRAKESKTYLIKPIDDESDLIYFNWVHNNIKKVSEATNNEVGYIHIPDMSIVGLNEFVKYYYPQLSKKALIIDDRGNGGGNVSPMLIERLRREMSMMAMSRDVPVPNIKPNGMLYGPKVLIIDQYSASDGDLFPYQFRKHKLGQIVGVRTWGGVVGIRGSLPFVDGASLHKPEFAHYDENGWIIEGFGVKPDITVSNDPYQEVMNIDYQLDKAIEVIVNELAKYNKSIPPIPEFPNKSE